MREGQPSAGDAAKEGSQTPPPLHSVLTELLQATFERYKARVELLALDVQRAGAAVMQLLMLLFLMAFVAWAFWLCAVIGLSWAFVQFGGRIEVALSLALGFHGLALFLLWQRVLRLLRYVTLPAVRTHLTKGNHE